MLNALKWFGTICVILAATCRAFDLHTADLILSILGAGVWAGVAIKAKDNPLLVVNGFIVAILLFGVFK